VTPPLECTGSRRCGNPMRVARLIYCGLPQQVSGPDGRRLRLWGAANALPGACRKARERRTGRNPFQSSVANPGRAKPKGASSGLSTLTKVLERQGFSRGSKPRNRGLPGRPVAPATEATAGKTVSGFTEPETTRYLAGGVSSEGWIPRAPPVRKKTGPGSEGVSRAEGNQTLNAEVGGRGKPVRTGLPNLASAVGSKSPWEEPAGCGRRLGSAEVFSGGERNSKRGFVPVT